MQYLSLYVSYGVVAILVIILLQKSNIWDSETHNDFEKPWLEFLYLIGACFVVIGIGQLYVADIKLPSHNPILESVNQLLIFSPVLILLFSRHKNLNSAWIDTTNISLKLLSGLGLAVIAVLIYSIIGSEKSFLTILFDTYAFENLGYLVQVLLEDIVIAALLLRLLKATSLKITLIIVPALFALGHVPTMIAEGLALEEFYSLFLDAGLGFFLCYTILKTRDILWFWMVHFAMDMMQFYA